MNSHRIPLALAGLILFTAVYVYSEEAVDLSVIHRIKAEAFENSKVMDHEFYLTDVHGPRLTNSPGYREAGEWVMKRLKEYGLTNVHEEPWSFGRGWTYTHYAGHMVEPQYSPLIGFPLAWTPWTNGVVHGDAIYAPITSDADLEKFRGKLKGKIVLTMASKVLAMQMEPQGRRMTDADLAARTQIVDPSRLGNPFRAAAGTPSSPGARESAAPLTQKFYQYSRDQCAL